MFEWIEWSRLAAGLGAFLLGMHLLENSMAELSGASFNRLLQKATSNPWVAMLWGTLATAVLQSSSLFSLMVVALVGAGVLTLANAIALIVGANIGTTATGWMVALLGFKLSVEKIAQWGLGLGSILALVWGMRPWVKQIGLILAGLSVLFIGLEWMKHAIVQLAEIVDVSAWQQLPVPWLLLIGFGLTAVLQSSSAMMAIALGGIHSQVLVLKQAAVLMVGAGLGTTLTVFLGAIDGNAAKRRVVWTHFLFNLLVALLALPWIDELLLLINTHDPLLALVAFYTLINVVGALLFVPFIKPFSYLLERWVRGKSQTASALHYLHEVSPEQTEAAIIALRKETISLAHRVIELGRQIWLQPTAAASEEVLTAYRHIKNYRQQMLDYVVRVQQHLEKEAEAQQLTNLLWAIRRLGRAAKTIKDIHADVAAFRQADTDEIHLFIEQIKEHLAFVLDQLVEQQALWLDSSAGPLVGLWMSNRRHLHSLRQQLVLLLEKGDLHTGRVVAISNLLYETFEYIGELIDGLNAKPEMEETIEEADLSAGQSSPTSS